MTDEVRMIEMRATDDPKTRARNVFRKMGLAIRADDSGLLMIYLAAEIMEHYRNLDREAAKTLGKANAEA